MRWWTAVLTVVACAAVSMATAAPRNSGPRLDRTFGRAGVAVLRVPSQIKIRKSLVPGWDVLDSVADSSGRVYVLFGSMLAAYDDEGRLDGSFGDLGARDLGLLGYFTKVTLDPAGRIVVVGAVLWDATDPNSSGTVVVRLLPNGRLDPDFGFGGVQRQESLHPWDILSDGSGGVLVLAEIGNPRLWQVFRLGPDGMLDHTYGDNGFAVLPRIGRWDPGPHTIDATGRFVAVDWDDVEDSPPSYALVGLDASGHPDPAIGENGTRMLDFGPHTLYPTDVGVDAMGRYVLLGIGDPPRKPTFIARFLPDGTPDATWSGTTDGVREILADGKLWGTHLNGLAIDGATYYAHGVRNGPDGRHWGDSVVVRVDDGAEQVWTSRFRYFRNGQSGVHVVSARDGAVLLWSYLFTTRRPRRVDACFVRLLFD